MKKLKKLITYDTLVEEFEKDQNIKLGVNSRMKMGTYYKKIGYKSLAEMLKK